MMLRRKCRFVALGMLLLFSFGLKNAQLRAGDETAKSAVAEGMLILSDDFDRSESTPELEEVGNGWSTNSKSRAKGVKQVDLRDGAMFVHRADEADHGVSVVHDLEFKNAHIQMQFKIGKADSLGINIADMKEKSVHAGHICVALVKHKQLEIADLKTGRMALERRKRRQAGEETQEDKARVKDTVKRFSVETSVDQWHQLDVLIRGNTMMVKIDDKPAGEFSSEGIGHPTKRRIRLAVAKDAWVDDVRVWRMK